ncbi:hypothetical protein [Variovorax sp. YR216]|uniref:hypothetical protein n=1 Tax=Variovorax sp. YR216 TaxID=1882828 RepID=UPI0008973C25|nr:hypothetical protein [Variovorax sp. YR216]SEB08658.1 hypothetical protein SAMN05444680_107101 [Variovorax sp. YR216]
MAIFKAGYQFSVMARWAQNEHTFGTFRAIRFIREVHSCRRQSFEIALACDLIAAQIDANAPLAVAASKRIVDASRTWRDGVCAEAGAGVAGAVIS